MKKRRKGEKRRRDWSTLGGLEKGTKEERKQEGRKEEKKEEGRKREGRKEGGKDRKKRGRNLFVD